MAAGDPRRAGGDTALPRTAGSDKGDLGISGARLLIDLGFLPAIGAVHGYVTNWLAIRLLFRPRQPWRVPLLGLTVWGVLPRRQHDLARSVGEAVERELLQAEDLVRLLAPQDLQARIAELVATHAQARLVDYVPWFLPDGLRTRLAGYMAELVAQEAGPVVERVLEDAQRELRRRVRIAPLVEARLSGLRVDELETLVRRVAGRELHWIEGLGFLMGLTIGLLQGGFLLLLGR